MIIFIAIVPYINQNIFYQHRLNFNEVSFIFHNEQSNRSVNIFIHKDCTTRNIAYDLLLVSPINHGKNVAKLEFHPKGISKISIVSSSHFSKGLKYSTMALASIFLLPVISSRTSGHGLERPACNNFLINLKEDKVNPQSVLMKT